MQIQIRTDNHIDGGEELTRQVEVVAGNALGRFSNWITRVEVQLSDENSGSKDGDNDQRCVMEARPAGLSPITASHRGATLDQALSGCAKKLARLLDSTSGRLGDSKKGRISYGGEQTI